MVKKSSALIDMHNRVSAAELSRIIRLQLETLEKNPAAAQKIPPIMVWGAPGLGKSTIIRQAAEDMGIDFIDVRLAQREPVDVRGLPVPDAEHKSTEWFVSGDWPREGRGILLFDELTAADRSLQVAAYELILDRRLGNLYKIPDGWYICAAGNRVDDAAVAATMSSALANRFLHVELGEDAASWANWAVNSGIHPSVTAFIRFRPECLFRQDDENLERGWPTPRAWERVSVMLETLPSDDEVLLRKIVYGLVGPRAGGEFLEFNKLNDCFTDVYQLMTDETRKVSIPVKADRKYAFASALSYFLWRGADKNEEAILLDGFFRISCAMTSDFACMTMMDAMTGGGRISSKEAAQKLYSHPRYKEWKQIHGSAMGKHMMN